MLQNDLKVRELMKTKVVTVSMDANLKSVQELFTKHKIHHLIVMRGDKPVGILSDRDMLKNISPFVGLRFSQRPQDVATLRTPVHKIMKRKLLSVEPGTTAAEAAIEMLNQGVSCLAVMGSEGKLAGVITMHDIVRCAVKEQLEACETA